MNQEIESDPLLESHDSLNFLFDEFFILGFGDFTFAQFSSGRANLLGLLEKGSNLMRFKIGCGHTGNEPMVVVGNLGRLRCVL